MTTLPVVVRGGFRLFIEAAISRMIESDSCLCDASFMQIAHFSCFQLCVSVELVGFVTVATSDKSTMARST
jgi:hypothetical protein